MQIKFVKYSSVLTISLLLFILSPNVSYALGDPIGNIATETILPYVVASHQGVIKNGRILIFGGASSTYNSEVSAANINPNGPLSEWSIISNLPQNLLYHSVLTNNDNIYLIGGQIPLSPGNAISTDKVYVTKIDSDGNLSSWMALSSLPQRLALGRTLIYNNILYYIGGFTIDPGGPRINQSGVYSARINPDGTIEPWEVLQSLPEGMHGFSVFNIENKIMVVGGRTNSTSASSMVLSTNINTDGTITSWTNDVNLPEPSYRPSYIKTKTHLLLLGGYIGSTITSSIKYASINADGTLDPWTSSLTNLPKVNCCFTSALNKNDLYITGGHNGIGYYSSVFKISIIDSASVIEVPDIKQYSLPWSVEEYDRASIWSSNPTIERWGCALTSASMVLQKYGHTATPDTLNSWLNKQPDGYVRNGLLNWLAVSRYSKINATTNSPALEFLSFPADRNILDSELENKRPPIVRVPGHFVVVKGKTGTGYVVNDPASTNFLLSEVEADRLGPYSKIYSYYPSTTDLSYIMLVLDTKFDIKLFDDNGNEITGDYFTEHPLKYDSTNILLNEESLGIFMYPKPNSGTYTIQVSGISGNYQLDSYLYDKNGNVQYLKNKGIVNTGKTDIYLVSFNKESSEKSNVSEVSYDGFLKDLKTAYKSGGIKRRSIYWTLRRLVLSSKRYYKRGWVRPSKSMLILTNRLINRFTPRYIEPDTSTVLQRKIRILRVNL